MGKFPGAHPPVFALFKPLNRDSVSVPDFQ